MHFHRWYRELRNASVLLPSRLQVQRIPATQYPASHYRPHMPDILWKWTAPLSRCSSAHPMHSAWPGSAPLWARLSLRYTQCRSSHGHTGKALPYRRTRRKPLLPTARPHRTSRPFLSLNCPVRKPDRFPKGSVYWAVRSIPCNVPCPSPRETLSSSSFRSCERFRV